MKLSIKKKIILQLAVLAVITGIVYFGNYSNSYGNYDDYIEILYNKNVNPRESPLSAVFTNVEAFHFYVPFKHAVNYVLNVIAPFNAHVSHLFSDFLHILNVFLCFFLVLLLSKSNRIAFLTALMFAVAPVAGAAVNEIAARGHMFTAFFAMLSFIFYILADKENIKKQLSLILRIASAAVYVLGLFFWPNVIVLPAVLLCYEILKDNKISIKQLWARLLLPFALSATAVLATNIFITLNFISHRGDQAVLGEGLVIFYNFLGWSSVYKMPAILAEYIIYSFRPPFFDIVFSPYLPSFAEGFVFYISRFAVVAAFIAVCVLVYRKNKKLLTAPAIFIFFLLPGLLLLYNNEYVSLRYMYLPCIGIFFTVFAFLEYYVFTVPKESYKKWLAVFLTALWFTYAAVNTSARKYTWRNPSSITNSMIENGGTAEFWGWYFKTAGDITPVQKLIYLERALEILEKDKIKNSLRYNSVKRRLTQDIYETLTGEKTPEYDTLDIVLPPKEVKGYSF